MHEMLLKLKINLLSAVYTKRDVCLENPRQCMRQLLLGCFNNQKVLSLKLRSFESGLLQSFSTPGMVRDLALLVKMSTKLLVL